MITYSDAAARVARSRSGSPKLMANTYIHRVAGGYVIRYYCTDIVTIREDGSYILSTGGWNTVTTLRRINDYGPARVSSDRGTLVVWNRDDPRTPVKMQRCRVCHGTGETHSTAYTQYHGILPRNTYEVTTGYVWNSTDRVSGITYDGFSYAFANALMRDGARTFAEVIPANAVKGQPGHINLVGQVTRHDRGTYGRLPEPVFHPSVASVCWHCHGAKVYDYGSKPRPVIFYDGITVDGYGKVTDPSPARMYPTPEEIAAKAAADERAARLWQRRNRDRLRRERDEWLSNYELTVKAGKITVYKAVDAGLRSAHHAPGARGPFPYPIGETVTVPDWRPVARCGGGLHFGPTPRVARSYFREATRFLACEVRVAGMVIIGDKIKAKSARVLYEVDIDGNRI